MARVNGIHHITAISGSAQENYAFYTGVLGMRLVKRSVNQDDPGTYHLFYADNAGHPGTDLTFFPWTQMAPPRRGHGLTQEVYLAVPKGSLGYWEGRLALHGITPRPMERRFGELVLPFSDPHGLDLALAETSDERLFTPWPESPVPAEFQIRGLHGARTWAYRLAPTADFLTRVLGLDHVGEENGWHRFGLDGGKSGTWIEVLETPNELRGQWGIGSVHHIAWRVDDDAHEMAVRAQVDKAGRRPTPQIDRFWFRSVYFSEPGGVIFELATDGPGFGVDEDPAHLGESLILPPWLEPHRAQIEAALPPLDVKG